MKNPRLARRPPRVCSLYIVHCSLFIVHCQKILPKKGVLKKCKLERKNGSKTTFRRTPIDFTMQRRLFYDATHAVLPCKTASVAV